MRPFTLAISVKPDDIDELGHVNNVVYIRWVQEVAAAHWTSISTVEMNQRYLWVVLRHEIDYRNPAFLTDTITGTTWVGEHHGARFERFVSLISNTGKLLAEAKTIWCLIDRTRMKPLRIPVDILSLL